MKRLMIAVFLMILAAGCSHVAPPGEVMTKGCGPYPEQYTAMIQDFLNHQINRPDAVETEDITMVKAPEKIILDADYPFIPLFKGHDVWECFIARDGGKSGKKAFHVVWIRHHRIVAVDYKGVDLGYAIKNRRHNQFDPDNRAADDS